MLPLLTGKEEVFGAAPEGLFTEPRRSKEWIWAWGLRQVVSERDGESDGARCWSWTELELLNHLFRRRDPESDRRTHGQTDDRRTRRTGTRTDGRRRNRREENTRSDRRLRTTDRPTIHLMSQEGPGWRRSWAGPSENGRIRNKRPLFKYFQARKCFQCIYGILLALSLMNTK